VASRAAMASCDGSPRRLVMRLDCEQIRPSSERPRACLHAPSATTLSLLGMVIASNTDLGDFQFRTSCTLLGSTEMPLGVRTCPKNCTRSNQNSHLLNLAYNLCSLNQVSTIRRCWACSSLFLEYIKMSSINTTTNLSNSGTKTEFMRYMKNGGALVRPKDNRNSHKRYIVPLCKPHAHE